MTLSDYLFLLKASAEALSPLGNHVMFYLAAAVSDFYIPDSELVCIYFFITFASKVTCVIS